MCRSLPASVALLAALSFTAVADDAGTFEERVHVFTGGEYKNEEFRYMVLNPPEIEPGKKYPLVYFMHGAGERGSDPKKLLRHFPVQMTKPEWRAKYPCFLVMPQCRDGKLWMNQPWGEKEFKPLDKEPNAQMAMAMAILETSLKNPHVDRSRVYLTGLSMGGFGSWELAMRRPELFAALAPVCGGGDESKAARLKDIPIWTGHGDADRVVWPIRSQRMVEAIRKAGGKIKYTEYPGVGHNSWTPFYADKDGVVPWMFEQRRK
jgi:predicted peptidase